VPLLKDKLNTQQSKKPAAGLCYSEAYAYYIILMFFFHDGDSTVPFVSAVTFNRHLALHSAEAEQRKYLGIKPGNFIPFIVVMSGSAANAP